MREIHVKIREAIIFIKLMRTVEALGTTEMLDEFLKYSLAIVISFRHRYFPRELVQAILMSLPQKAT